MIIFHRKLFPYLTSTSNGTTPCTDFCDPSCSNFDDCYPFSDPEFLPPLPSPPSLPPPITSLGTDKGSINISPVVIVVIIVLLSIFLLITYYAIFTRYCSNCSRLIPRRANENRPPPPPDLNEADDRFFHELDGGAPIVDHPIWLISTIGLQQSVINSITAIKYKQSEGLVEGTDCSVCLSEFTEGENLRLLPKCNHAFHIDCIDTWLRSHTNCPLCRAAIVVSSGRSLASNEPSFDHSRRTETTRVEFSDMSDVEMGGTQTGGDNDSEELRDNREEAGEYEGDPDDENKNNGNNERVSMSRSYSMDYFRGSNSRGNVGDANSRWTMNSSSFRVMGNSSSASSARRPLPLLAAPIIKRSYSWSERVYWSTCNIIRNNNISP